MKRSNRKRGPSTLQVLAVLVLWCLAVLAAAQGCAGADFPMAPCARPKPETTAVVDTVRRPGQRDTLGLVIVDLCDAVR